VGSAKKPPIYGRSSTQDPCANDETRKATRQSALRKKEEERRRIKGHISSGAAAERESNGNTDYKKRLLRGESHTVAAGETGAP